MKLSLKIDMIKVFLGRTKGKSLKKKNWKILLYHRQRYLSLRARRGKELTAPWPRKGLKWPYQRQKGDKSIIFYIQNHKITSSKKVLPKWEKMIKL